MTTCSLQTIRLTGGGSRVEQARTELGQLMIILQSLLLVCNVTTETVQENV